METDCLKQSLLSDGRDPDLRIKRGDVFEPATAIKGL